MTDICLILKSISSSWNEEKTEEILCLLDQGTQETWNNVILVLLYVQILENLSMTARNPR